MAASRGGLGENRGEGLVTFFNAFILLFVDFWFDEWFWHGDALRRAAKPFSSSGKELVDFLLEQNLSTYPHMLVMLLVCLALMERIKRSI